jgi:hypothetical protein
MRSLDKRGDTPSMDDGDGLKVEVIDHPFKFANLANDPETVEAIVATINLMGGAGDCAEDDYQAALSKLTRQARKISPALTEEYFALPEGQYLDRWSLVMLLAELRDRESVHAFARILESEIPAERSKDPHSFTTVGEEVMIRTTAIEGLERLAAEGSEDAMKVLMANVHHETFSICRAAVQALVAVGGEEMKEKLKEMLPERHHRVLEIRRVDVREVEQAEGGLFLKPADDGSIPPPNDEECK